MVSHGVVQEMEAAQPEPTLEISDFQTNVKQPVGFEVVACTTKAPSVPVIVPKDGAPTLLPS